MQEIKVCDGPTDGQTDRRTDRVTYRVACTRLKIVLGHLLNNSARWLKKHMLETKQSQKLS